MHNEVKPALDKGKLVICDRYIYSSLAYQGSAGLSLDWIKTINTRSLQPDLSVFIDVSPEKVLERLQRKKSVMETLDTQRKVREVYLKYVDNGELIRIDGDKEKRLVAEDLYRVVSGLLKDAKKFV
jgi:dTMP kinase